MNSLQDKLLSQTKKPVGLITKFDPNSVSKILKIKYPELTELKLRKAYKLVIIYEDKDKKIHQKTIYFGDKSRVGCEFVDHKNKEIRDKYIKTLDKFGSFFEKNFMNRWLLNGERESLLENWELLKSTYLTQ